MPAPLSGPGRADLHLGQGRTLRPDTLMQTAQIKAQKPLADGAGHTLRAPFAVWLRALPGRMRGRSFRTSALELSATAWAKIEAVNKIVNSSVKPMVDMEHGAWWTTGTFPTMAMAIARITSSSSVAPRRDGLPASRDADDRRSGRSRRGSRRSDDSNRSRRVVISSLSVSRSWMTCSSSPTICPKPSQIDKSQ